MLLNKNIVFEIIDTNFIDDVTACCEESVLRMDEGELSDYFEEYADKACLAAIYDINVENYDDEETDGIQTVEGLLEIAALINGYADWGDEAEYIGDAESCVCHDDPKALFQLTRGVFSLDDVEQSEWVLPAGAFQGAAGGPC